MEKTKDEENKKYNGPTWSTEMLTAVYILSPLLPEGVDTRDFLHS